MSERSKPHNGRDNDGNFRVKRVDVDDTITDPEGVDFLRDDVRQGGAVADIGADAGRRAAEIGERIEENRENVRKLTDEQR
jgi:DNA-binding protein YbaB